MELDRVALLLGASFAVGFNQTFDALIQVVQLSLTLSPRSAADLLAKAAPLAVGLFVTYCAARKKAPVRGGFIAAAGYEVAAVFFACLWAALGIKAAVEAGLPATAIIVIVVKFLGPTAVLIGYTAVLVTTWLKLPPTAASTSLKAPAKGTTYWRSYWLGATACIMFELAVLGLTNAAVLGTMPVPLKPEPLKVVFFFEVAMFGAQALLAPVGLYGALAANRACLLTALVLTVTEVLEYMVLFVLYVVFLLPPATGATDFIAVAWLIVGGRVFGAALIAATAYKYTVAPGEDGGGKYKPLQEVHA